MNIYIRFLIISFITLSPAAVFADNGNSEPKSAFHIGVASSLGGIGIGLELAGKAISVQFGFGSRYVVSEAHEGPDVALKATGWMINMKYYLNQRTFINVGYGHLMPDPKVGHIGTEFSRSVGYLIEVGRIIYLGTSKKHGITVEIGFESGSETQGAFGLMYGYHW